MIADVGQGDDIEAVVEKARKTGAAKVVVEDLREEFLHDYVCPALRAGVGGGVVAFAGGEGDESGADDGGVERGGVLAGGAG